MTDALQLMLDDNEKFSTFPVDGWFDIKYVSKPRAENILIKLGYS